MAEKTLNTRQKQKYDTSTNWTTNNPVLLAGELGIESDTNKFKIGNGTSAWNELDYAGGGEVVLYSTTGQNTDGAMTQKAVTDAIPTTLSDLSEDSTHRLVTDTEKSTWNAKSDFSGSYNDLTDKPTIPTDNAQLTNGAGYTKVTVNDVAQTNLDFDTDPQTQIDNLDNIVKTKVQEITLTGLTSGTITAEQLTTLQADDSNYILLNDEIYRLADKQDASGYRVYTNTGQGKSNFFTKSLTITLSTLAWTLISRTIVDSGANVNGYYTKIADGTLICRGSDSWGSRNNGTVHHTFPYAFISAPSVVITAKSPNYGGLASSPATSHDGYITTTYFQYTIYGVAGGDRNTGADFIAIGRWK